MTKGKKLLCINHACPHLGRPIDFGTCLPAGHWAVIAREGDWPTQETGGYTDAQGDLAPEQET